MFFEKRRELCVDRTGEGFVAGELAEFSAGKTVCLEEVAAREDNFDAVDIVHDSAVFFREFIAGGVRDKGADCVAGVSVDGQGQAIGGENGVQLSEGDSGLDMNEAVVSVELANMVQFFGRDDKTGGKIGAGFREAGAADGNREMVFFLGKLVDEFNEFTDVGSGLGDGNKARNDF